MESAAPVAFELRCFKCEYILRGLAPTGICPECATPIAESFKEHQRNNEAPPKWALRRIRRVSAIISVGVADFVTIWQCTSELSTRSLQLVVIGLTFVINAHLLFWALASSPLEIEDPHERQLANVTLLATVAAGLAYVFGVVNYVYSLPFESVFVSTLMAAVTVRCIASSLYTCSLSRYDDRAWTKRLAVVMLALSPASALLAARSYVRLVDLSSLAVATMVFFYPLMYFLGVILNLRLRRPLLIAIRAQTEEDGTPEVGN